MIDSQGRPPGVLGIWPSRAITFLENHDTGGWVRGRVGGWVGGRALWVGGWTLWVLGGWVGGWVDGLCWVVEGEHSLSN